jgi:hypothetical protein
MPDYERKYLVMAALLAPAAGIAAVSGLVLLLFGTETRILTGLFYVLLVGGPIAYALEFLGVWYFRERLKGGALRLQALLPISAVLGLLTPVVPIYGFNIVTPTVSWMLIAGLGVVGGVVSAVTFWILAPTPSPR